MASFIERGSKEAGMINKMSDNLIFFIVQTQYQNLGDLIINKTLLEKMREHGKLMINDRNAPDWFSEELGITAAERVDQYNLKFNRLLLWSAFKRRFQKNKNTYLVLTPGHIYDAHPDLKLKPTLRSIFDFLLLNIMGVRICRFGASVGPFFPLGQMAERWKSRLMYFYSVRDSISETYVHELGIQNVQRFPDLAWLMNVERLARGKPQTQFSDNYVIFSFRASTHKLDNSNLYKESLYPVLDQIAHFVCGELAQKLVISYQVKRDYETCQEIKDRYQEQYKPVLIENQVNRQDMQQIYAHASLVFSNRLHVLVFAMAHGAIPIAVVDVEKHSKVVGIFSDVGLMHLVIDIQNPQIHLERLYDVVANIDKNREQIKCLFDKMRSCGDELLDRVMS
jgi:polysaccharide pyruvyl transferase WcaK-like protein